tara:strand:+ start:968 stop:1207 length:240 start_codon:yes stop_codon:yes gene_type:complete
VLANIWIEEIDKEYTMDITRFNNGKPFNAKYINDKYLLNDEFSEYALKLWVTKYIDPSRHNAVRKIFKNFEDYKNRLRN